MQWKLQREDHNRQDKTKKPDYRENFIAESQHKMTPLHLESFKDILAYKAELIRRYEIGNFVLENRNLRLTWGLTEYARDNKLETLVNRRYKPHMAAARADFAAIREAIRNGEAVWGISPKGQQQPQVVFSVRLQCEFVIPCKHHNDEIVARSLMRV